MTLSKMSSAICIFILSSKKVMENNNVDARMSYYFFLHFKHMHAFTSNAEAGAFASDHL